MKNFLFIILFFTLGSAALMAQNALQEMKKAIDDKDYEKASKIVEQVVQQNPENLEARMLAGDVYTEYKQFDKALIEYKAAYEIDDENLELLRKLAMAYAKTDDHEMAEEIAEEALDEDDESLENQLTLAEVYIEAGNFEDAELAITKARNMAKESPKPYTALGDLYFASNVYELAKTNYEEALSIDSTIVDARVNLAKSYFWLGNREYDEELRSEYYKRSLQEWGKVTKFAPKDANAYFEQGRILYMAKIFDKAAQALNNYVQLRPSGDLGRWWLAQSLYEIGRCDSAAPHLRIVSEKIDSVQNESLLLLARCYGNNNDYEKSAKVYEELAQKDILEVADTRRYGRAVLFSGDTTKAINILENAIKEDPDAPESCQLRGIIGQIEIRRKNFEDAVKFFEDRINNPACEEDDNSQVLYLAGYSYLFAGKNQKEGETDSLENYRKAIEYFQKTIEKDSTKLLANLFMGDAYINLEENEKGIEQYRYVADAVTDTTGQDFQLKVQALQKISNYYLQEKQWSKLSSVTKEWTQFDAENEWAWLFRAIGAQGTQRLEDACSFYAKVLEINPENSTAQKNYSRFCTE